MANNPFLYPAEHYQRSIAPITHWAEQTAWYASKMRNLDYATCLAHIKKKIADKTLPIDDPVVVFNYREKAEDSVKTSCSLTKYLEFTLRKGNILAPSGTTYLPASVKRSKIAGILDKNVIRRSVLKKKSQEFEFKAEKENAEADKAEAINLMEVAHEHRAKAKEYKLMAAWYHRGQDNRKRSSNSVTGNLVAEGTAIRNPTGHSTVTSTTRCLASFSNASNERIISGSRHYYKPEIVINNLASICTHSDFDLIEAAMEQYGLRYPSVDEVTACITHSSDRYFRDTRKMKEIRELVTRLSLPERAAVVYTGDLYHLKEVNPDFVRQFLTELADVGQPVEDPDARSKIRGIDEMVVNYAHQYHISMMAGIGKDYNLLTDDQAYKLYGTCLSIVSVIEKYHLLLRAFFLTENHPATIATVPQMIRSTVPLSDTDSTLFSVDNWVEWYFGSFKFNDRSCAVGGAVSYIATQSIAHILAHFSANMNVERSRLFSMQMKPEYFFPVFGQTTVAKHYYTAMWVKEGSVYEKLKMEIKGVHMKDSTIPKIITAKSAEMMEFIIHELMEGRRISLTQILMDIIAVEQMIASSLLKAESTYLRRLRLKSKEAYANGGGDDEDEVDKTNYRHYTCWQMAFASTYGNYPPPPYLAITIPLDLPNKTATQKWLNGLENRKFAEGFQAWLDSQNMVKIGALHLPIDFCRAHGIPPELKPIVDFRRVILALTKSFRNILESLGYFPKHEMTITEMHGMTF